MQPRGGTPHTTEREIFSPRNLYDEYYMYVLVFGLFFLTLFGSTRPGAWVESRRLVGFSGFSDPCKPRRLNSGSYVSSRNG